MRASTAPYAIGLLGSGKDIRIRHNRFLPVNAALRFQASGKQDLLDEVVVSDNEILHTDNACVEILEGKAEDGMPPYGRLGDVKLLRNRIYMAGLWPTRMSHGHCVTINGAQSAEIAGNFLHRIGGWGISVRGGKAEGIAGDVPFIRYLIHHNKVIDPLLFSNDWGGIEAWQGGPIYIFNNIVGNPVGYMWGGSRRFGHAYYLDPPLSTVVRRGNSRKVGFSVRRPRTA